jgi:hypothetical protein
VLKAFSHVVVGIDQKLQHDFLIRGTAHQFSVISANLPAEQLVTDQTSQIPGYQEGSSLQREAAKLVEAFGEDPGDQQCR